MSGFRLARRGTVLELVLARPPLNILNLALMRDMTEALRHAQAGAEDAHALLLSGEGRAFCAGVDVAEHMGPSAGPMLRTFHELIRLLWHWPAPTIAAVEGAALGGGCELAIACDIVLASERATFAQPEVKVGVFPPVSAVVLPALIGRQKTLRFLLSGETVTASTAYEWGLVSEVFHRDHFSEGVEHALRQFASLSRSTSRLTKRAVALASDGWDGKLAEVEHLYLERLMATKDATEGLQAFLEKREPVWRHQ